MDFLQIPVGLGMALAQNEMAMMAFESLPDAEKRAVLERAHGVNSKLEMRQIVADLVQKPTH